MNYAAIKNNDIANGDGVRVSLFVSGCSHHCKGCFNKETWDFNYGEPFTTEIENQIIEMLKAEHIKGLTILGGEPMEVPNQQALLPFLQRIRKEFGSKKDIWCYTGYTLETDLLSPSRVNVKETQPLLSLIDVLVDGEFIEEKKDISLKFRGSSNQRIIDLSSTLKMGFTLLEGRTSIQLYIVTKEDCRNVECNIFESKEKARRYMNYCIKDFESSESFKNYLSQRKQINKGDDFYFCYSQYSDDDFYISIEEKELF